MSLRDLKKKRTSVLSTKKLTSAMKMISSTKFVKAKAEIEKCSINIEYLNEISGKILQEYINMYSVFGYHKHLPYIMNSESVNQSDLPTLLIVLASNNGLCGSFNNNIIKQCVAFLEENSNENIELIVLSDKAAISLKKEHKISERFKDQKLSSITSIILDLYQTKQIKKCIILYSKFFNAIKQSPIIETVLPISVKPYEEGILNDRGIVRYIPSMKEVFEKSVMSLFLYKMNYIINENYLSEHAARMTAMNNATDNAAELIRKLNLEYNTLRQEIVTRELIEIIVGAESV